MTMTKAALTSEGREIKTTAAEALDDAFEVINEHLRTTAHSEHQDLSLDEFVSEMTARNVSVSAAQDVLAFLQQTGAIDLLANGRIRSAA